MTIRRATLDDKKELIRLFINFENRAQSTFPEIQNKYRTYTKELSKIAEEITEHHLSLPEYIFFVAEDNGTLQGYISGKIQKKEFRVYNKEGYIEGWYVEENHQNKGVGKQLYDALVEEFKKANCTHLGLDTHLENTKATAIYEHMGFTKRLVTFFKLLQDLP